MCRLFGMTGSPERVKATLWLLDAPDSLSQQSHREPDGTGLGVYDVHGAPVVDKWPIAAYEDREFAREARDAESVTFVGHIRFASTGACEKKNTHPFEPKGRILAHNGVIEDLPRLEAELGDYRSLVLGDTDSERLFALITRQIDAHSGDVAAGLAAAVRWVAENLPLFAVNLVLATHDELWALRYPETHGLYVLERQAGGHHGNRHLETSSAAGTMRLRSSHLKQRPAVIVASESLDENPGWRPLRSGELLHVGPDLTVSSTIAIDRAPRKLLTLNDLGPRAAASQRATHAT